MSGDAVSIVADTLRKALKPIVDPFGTGESDGWLDAWCETAAAASVDALGGLAAEWTVNGDCRNGDGKDCDHYGDHGVWTCSATGDTREEAAAFKVASEPDAYLVRRWVSGWVREPAEEAER